jgi:hypothetical protein
MPTVSSSVSLGDSTASREEREAIRNWMTSDTPAFDEPPTLEDWFDYEPDALGHRLADEEWWSRQSYRLEPRDDEALDLWMDDLSPVQVRDLSDDRTDALGGWEGGAQW